MTVVEQGTVTVRIADPGEYDAVDALVSAAYEHDYGPRTHSGDDPSRLSRHRAEQFDVWVAVDADGTLLGSITTRRPGGPPLQEGVRDDELDLRLLAVSPLARRRGIGSLLVRHVEEQAASAGAVAVVLKTAPPMVQAHRLYEALGYRRDPQRDGFWRGGEKLFDLLTYVKDV